MTKMKTNGWFWHVHHDVLAEWSDDINERIAFIKKRKPENERALRLKLLKPVKGKLPAKLVKAGKAYAEAGEACDKAGEAYDKAREAYDKARKAYDKAREAYYKAKEAHKKEMEALHKKECPNCPWTGSSIFK